MSELRLYAASENELGQLVGLELHDPETANRVLVRAEEYRRDHVNLRQLLTHGPWEDDVWIAVEVFVAALSWADVMPHDVNVAEELDALFGPHGFSPRLTATPMNLPLPEPHNRYMRVLHEPDATAMAKAWLALENAEHSELTTFCREYLDINNRAHNLGRGCVDIIMSSPTAALQRQRFDDPTWPPPAAEPRGISPELVDDVEAFLAQYRR